jgi:enterobactin synthetase component D
VHSPLNNLESPLTSHPAGPELGGWALSTSSLPLAVCANPQVLPPVVQRVSVTFDPLELEIGEQSWRWLPIPEGLEMATLTRQFEFLAGRACVADALRALGHDAVAPVRRRNNGTPVWPAGIIGSITHTTGFVSAAVARTSAAGGVGIDSEAILSRERALRVAAVFASRGEISVGLAAGLDAEESVTLIFSAKEAIFKCLHRFVRRMFDFDDVRITGIDAANRRFTAVVVNTLATVFPAGSTLSGAFEIASGRVHTGMMVEPLVRE